MALKFACGGCNNVPGALASLEEHSLAAYASGPNVVLLRTVENDNTLACAGPTSSLHVTSVLSTQRPSRVNCLALAAFPEGPCVLAIGFGDGSVWLSVSYPTATAAQLSWVAPVRAPPIARTAAALNGPTRPSGSSKPGTPGEPGFPVIAVDAEYSAVHDGVLVASTGMDSTINLWLLSKEAASAVTCENDSIVSVAIAQHALTSDHVLPECMALTTIDRVPFIAVGGTDREIRLYDLFENRIKPVGSLQGHRDWVRGLSFRTCLGASKSFLLASASTDTTVRVWMFSPDERERAVTESAHEALEVADKDQVFMRVAIGNKTFSVTLQGLLVDHSAAVLSASFSVNAGVTSLLTASADGSVSVWRVIHGRWEAIARFGLLGGSGTHIIGFCGAVFTSRTSTRVLAHTLSGGLHCWQSKLVGAIRAGEDGNSEEVAFVAESAPSGHASAVNDIEWSQDGRYFMTCGADKTTRIFAETIASSGNFVEWSRPQVHGHAVRDIAFLSRDANSFVSVSEEKVLRLFDAPLQFVPPGQSTFSKAVTQENVLDAIEQDAATSNTSTDPSSLVYKAAVPELGLSNTAVYLPQPAISGVKSPAAEPANEASVVAEGDLSSFGARKAAQSAPLEAELRQGRLWPERVKLYGHGNELSCVSVDRKRGLIASASRAQKAASAVIILWDAKSGTEVGRLEAHELTVNQLCFSADGSALLSVSRDRSFAVFSRSGKSGETPDASAGYSLLLRREKAHSRLIHSCCWTGRDNFVVTGSRDKNLKVFHIAPVAKSGEWAARDVALRKFDAGVSALDSKPGQAVHCDLLAVGLENGAVLVLKFLWNASQGTGDGSLHVVHAIRPVYACSDRVSQVAWRPIASKDGESHLAVASEDHIARVYAIDVAE